MRTPFRRDAIAFENMENWTGRPDSGVNFVMYFDLVINKTEFRDDFK